MSAVLVLDRTTITRPDELAARWAGCGGVELGAGRAQDRSSVLLHAPLPMKALGVADLGFSSLAVFAQNAEHHAFFVSRLHPQTRLFLAGAATPLDLVAWLERQSQTEMGRTTRLPSRLRLLAKGFAFTRDASAAHPVRFDNRSRRCRREGR